MAWFLGKGGGGFVLAFFVQPGWDGVVFSGRPGSWGFGLAMQSQALFWGSFVEYFRWRWLVPAILVLECE